jgi:hypothetical protein
MVLKTKRCMSSEVSINEVEGKVISPILMYTPFTPVVGLHAPKKS